MAFVKKGVVVPLGDTDDFDDKYVRHQSVIKHNGQFFLYYSGHDGSKHRIGLAISKDGMTFVKKGVVVPRGSFGESDYKYTISPAIIKHSGHFFLYYSGHDGSKYRIGLAISKDGMTFVKKGVVVLKGDTNNFDDVNLYNPSLIKHNGLFFLYYSGYSGQNIRIGLAISKDGMTFVKKGVVVPKGDTNDFDDMSASYPSIIKHNGQFFLYYSGFDISKWRIGLAISKDGMRFVKKGVVVPKGDTNDFDGTGVSRPSIIKHSGRFFLYYSGFNDSKYRIGLAISKDGL